LNVGDIIRLLCLGGYIFLGLPARTSQRNSLHESGRFFIFDLN